MSSPSLSDAELPVEPTPTPPTWSAHHHSPRLLSTTSLEQQQTYYAPSYHTPSLATSPRPIDTTPSFSNLDFYPGQIKSDHSSPTPVSKRYSTWSQHRLAFPSSTTSTPDSPTNMLRRPRSASTAAEKDAQRNSTRIGDFRKSASRKSMTARPGTASTILDKPFGAQRPRSRTLSTLQPLKGNAIRVLDISGPSMETRPMQSSRSLRNEALVALTGGNLPTPRAAPPTPDWSKENRPHPSLPRSMSRPVTPKVVVTEHAGEWHGHAKQGHHQPESPRIRSHHRASTSPATRDGPVEGTEPRRNRVRTEGGLDLHQEQHPQLRHARSMGAMASHTSGTSLVSFAPPVPIQQRRPSEISSRPSSRGLAVLSVNQPRRSSDGLGLEHESALPTDSKKGRALRLSQSFSRLALGKRSNQLDKEEQRRSRQLPPISLPVLDYQCPKSETSPQMHQMHTSPPPYSPSTAVDTRQRKAYVAPPVPEIDPRFVRASLQDDPSSSRYPIPTRLSPVASPRPSTEGRPSMSVESSGGHSTLPPPSPVHGLGLRGVSTHSNDYESVWSGRETAIVEDFPPPFPMLARPNGARRSTGVHFQPPQLMAYPETRHAPVKPAVAEPYRRPRSPSQSADSNYSLDDGTMDHSLDASLHPSLALNITSTISQRGGTASSEDQTRPVTPLEDDPVQTRHDLSMSPQIKRYSPVEWDHLRQVKPNGLTAERLDELARMGPADLTSNKPQRIKDDSKSVKSVKTIRKVVSRKLLSIFDPQAASLKSPTLVSPGISNISYFTASLPSPVLETLRGAEDAATAPDSVEKREAKAEQIREWAKVVEKHAEVARLEDLIARHISEERERLQENRNGSPSSIGGEFNEGDSYDETYSRESSFDSPGR